MSEATSSSTEFKASLSTGETDAAISLTNLSISIKDSIYNSFPTMGFSYNDISGISLEYNSFNPGLSMKSSLGYSDDFLETQWISTGRDTVKASTSQAVLSGFQNITAIHKSFLENRENTYKTFGSTTASKAVSELFSGDSLDVESTKGNISIARTGDPYEVVRDAILPLATDGKNSPFLFFRSLDGILHFCSMDYLLDKSVVASFALKSIVDDDTDPSNSISAFLPFNEKLDKVMPQTRVTRFSISDDLDLECSDYSVAKDVKGKVPILSKAKIDNDIYTGREFNPDMDYDTINGGIEHSALKYTIDKLFISVPFNKECVAGAGVEVKAVYMTPDDGSIRLSETFSGNWIVEQSTHVWTGEGSSAMSQLVLVRPSVTPSADSLLNDEAFE